MNKPLLYLAGGLAVVAVVLVIAQQAKPAPRSPTPVTAITPPAPATPTIGTTTATPTVIPVNTPTIVTVTSVITDPSLITTGINLLRINPTGNPTVLGQLRDDGTNGDAGAGDKTFTSRLTFNEPTTGQIQLQVSAAFRGILRRVTSPPLTLDVWNRLPTLILGVAVSYPSSWHYSQFLPNRIGFLPYSKQADPTLEYIADIIVEILPNPSHLDLETFYKTTAEIDWFGNSMSFQYLDINGLRTVKFIGTSGMIPTNIIAIAKDNVVVELSDIGQQHESDGVFNAIAFSIR